MTLGVRGLVLDAEGRVLLVRHTYVNGWHMPGGGVERGETAEGALARELVEEAGVRLTAPPMLVSIHSAHAKFKGDHILLLPHRRLGAVPGHLARRDRRGRLVRARTPCRTGPPTATRARIAEALAAADRRPHW